MVFQEKIKKLRNFLFGFEEIVFSICFGDYLKEIGYKNSKLGIAIYFNNKKSFKESVRFLGFMASKFYENIEFVSLNERIEKYSSPFLFELLNKGVILFVKNQEIYDKWALSVFNYYFDVEKIRNKFYV